MRVRVVCAVVCNALLGAASFSGCAQGTNGLPIGSSGGSGGGGATSTSTTVTASSSATTSTTTTTATTANTTTAAGTGGGTSTSGTGGQGASGASTSGTGGTSNGCTHDVCTVGPPLDTTCDACTASVCAVDPSCCDPLGKWDLTCVSTDVPAYCGPTTCGVDAGMDGGPDAGTDSGTDGGGTDGGSCSHDVCTAGPALDSSCSPCAASVCASDSFCCSVHWDSICAGSDVTTHCPGTICGADAGTDGGGMDGGPTDGGPTDGGPTDGGTTDGGPTDGGTTDGGSADGGTTDGGSADGGPCLLTHLVISEIRSRGLGGANDEFLELYNPTAASVTLDNTWKIDGRSDSATSYTTRWTGTGKTIPAHGHFLITGTTYAQTPAGDEGLMSGITDATSVVLKHGSGVVDAVCYGYSPSTLAAFNATYICAGTPVSNLPHNNSSVGMSNSDVSLERKPGGAAGNCTDSGDNASDFGVNAPATPQSSSSPPTP